MKRHSSAPCLTDEDSEAKKLKADEEPNTKEYLQLALAKVLELQREIKEGTYTSENTSDLDGSSSEEDLTTEVVRKVFKNLPGTPNSMDCLLKSSLKSNNALFDQMNDQRSQLMGYDACRRVAVDYMERADLAIRKESSKTNPPSNHPGFQIATYSINEPQMAQCRIGLLRSSNEREAGSSRDQEIRDRMLRSLNLYLALKQRDYTANLMRSDT